MKVSLRPYMRAALAILLGERCVVCGGVLPGAGVCPECWLRMPFLGLRGSSANYIERLFWGRTNVERASASLRYQPGNVVTSILHDIKYHGRSDLAVEMGRFMGEEHLRSGMFEGVDALMPVPLHRNRMRERGFNQSECLARGLSAVTGLPVVELVERRVDNVSQTLLEHDERRKNVEGIFALTPEGERYCSGAEAPQRGRHVLIVDDVITTGATVVSCAQVLPSSVRVSFLSLAYAGPMHLGRLSVEELRRSDCSVGAADFRERQYQSLS